MSSGTVVDSTALPESSGNERRSTASMKEIIAQIVAGQKVSPEQLKGLTISQRVVLQRLIRRIETLGKEIKSSVFAC